jgi:hypothetical protein
VIYVTRGEHTLTRDELQGLVALNSATCGEGDTLLNSRLAGHGTGWR